MFKRYYSLDNNQQQWNDWREMLTYPQHVKPLTINLLDELATMIPYPQNEDDRYSAISDWLERGYEEGLLTRQEYANIRSELGQQIWTVKHMNWYKKAQNVIEDPTMYYTDIGHSHSRDYSIEKPEIFLWIQIDGKIEIEKDVGAIHEENWKDYDRYYRGRIEVYEDGEIKISIITPNDSRRYRDIPEDIILYFQNKYGNVKFYVFR